MSETPGVEGTGDSGEMTIVCSHCGAETPLNSTSCTSCGNALDSVDPQWSAEATASEGSGWSRALAGIGCAVLVLVAAGAAFFVGCAILFM